MGVTDFGEAEVTGRAGAPDAVAGAITSHTITHARCAHNDTASPSRDGQIHGVTANRNDGRTNGLSHDVRARWCRRAAIARWMAVNDAGIAESVTMVSPDRSMRGVPVSRGVPVTFPVEIRQNGAALGIFRVRSDDRIESDSCNS